MGRDLLNTPGVKPLLVLAAVGVLLIIAGSLLRTGTSRKSQEAPIADGASVASRQSGSGDTPSGAVLERYRSDLEARCEGILSKVEGAGAVSVRITLEGSSLKAYAENLVAEERNTEEQASGQTKRSSERRRTREMVLLSDSSSGRGQAPVLLGEQAPRIAGVLVAAPGAADSAIKRELAAATRALLGVAAHRVMVVASCKP